jgi:hypothetical protein
MISSRLSLAGKFGGRWAQRIFSQVIIRIFISFLGWGFSFFQDFIAPDFQANSNGHSYVFLPQLGGGLVARLYVDACGHFAFWDFLGLFLLMSGLSSNLL